MEGLVDADDYYAYFKEVPGYVVDPNPYGPFGLIPGSVVPIPGYYYSE